MRIFLAAAGKVVDPSIVPGVSNKFWRDPAHGRGSHPTGARYTEGDEERF
jgi:hypothetical protein